jgi:multimeric flavodoxin WrbA
VEILLREVTLAVEQELGGDVVTETVRLNERSILPCQACGTAPTPSYCFYDDDMTALYRNVAECDCLVMGSPIHFDTVSSQAKLFIDRCNCIRPADFHHVDPDHNFLKLLERKRPGGIVLVGGEDGWFEGARRSIAGWFKWIEVVNEGVVMYRSIDFTKTGTAADDKTALTEARALGKALAGKIGYDYGR